MLHFKVVVVGAGPAGSTAALYLKKANIQTALIDKANFPRDKACGDGMPMKIVNLLEELGFREDELFSAGYKIKGMVVYSPQGNETRLGDPQDSGESKNGCIPRAHFDNLLFQKARRAADKTFAGYRLNNLRRERDKWYLDLKERQSSETLSLSADVVIGADGAHSLVAARAGLLQSDRSQTFDGLRRYYTGPDFEPMVHIFYDRRLLPGYLWIFPVAKNRVNVGLMTRRSKDRNLQRLFDEVLKDNMQVRKILRGARPDSPLRGALLALGNMPGERIADGLLLIGDAAAFINPVTGGGIYSAILSSREAARVAGKALSGGSVQKKDLQAYEDWWRKNILPGFLYAAWLKRRFESQRFTRWFLKKTARNRLFRNFFFMLYGRSLPKHSLINPLFWLRVFLAR